MDLLRCGWQVKETSEALNKFRVVQPFAWLVRMPPATSWINPADIDVSIKWEQGGMVPFRQIFVSSGYRVPSNPLLTRIY